MAERFNRTVTGSAHTLLFDSGLPLSLWGEAPTHAVYTKNRMPHPSLNNKSPHEVLTGEMPNLGYLQPFGSPAHVFIAEERPRVGGKLLARSAEGFLVVGYGEQRNQYRFWIPSPHRVVISRDFKSRVVTSVPEVIAVDTSSPEPSTIPRVVKDSSASDPSPNTVSWVPASMAEIRDRYPNLFKSTLPEPSSLESATPPTIIAPAPGTFPLSEPGSPTPQPRSTQTRVPNTNPTPDDSSKSTEGVPTFDPAPEVCTRSGREVRPLSRLGEWGEVALLGSTNEDEPSVYQSPSGRPSFLSFFTLFLLVIFVRFPTFSRLSNLQLGSVLKPIDGAVDSRTVSLFVLH